MARPLGEATGGRARRERLRRLEALERPVSDESMRGNRARLARLEQLESAGASPPLEGAYSPGDRRLGSAMSLTNTAAADGGAQGEGLQRAVLGGLPTLGNAVVSPTGTFEQIRDGRRERINALGTEMERAQADLRQLDEQSIGATRRLAEIQRLPDKESAQRLAAEVEAELTRINEQRKLARKTWEDTFTARDTETRALLSLLDQRVKDIQEGKAVLQPRPLDPNAPITAPGNGLNAVPLPQGITPQNALPRGITQAPLNRPDLDISQEGNMTAAERSGRENLRRILAKGGVLTRMEEAAYRGVPEQNIVHMSKAIDALNRNAGGWKKFKWALATGAVTITAVAASQVLLPGSLPFLVNGLGSLYAGLLPTAVANWSIPLVVGDAAFKIGVPAAMAAGTIGGLAGGYIGSLMERRRARTHMRQVAAAENLGAPVFKNDWAASGRTLFRTAFGGVVGTVGGAAFEATGVGPAMREYVTTQASSFGDWLSSILSQRTDARFDALDVRIADLANSVDGQSDTMDQMMRTIELMRLRQGRMSNMVVDTLRIAENLESQLNDALDQLTGIDARITALGRTISDDVRRQIGAAVAGIVNPRAPGAMTVQQIETLLNDLRVSQDRGFQQIFQELQALRTRVNGLPQTAVSALRVYTGLGAPNPWDAVTALAVRAGVRLPPVEQDVLNHAIGLVVQDNPRLLGVDITDVRRIPDGIPMNFDFLRWRTNYDAVLSIIDQTRTSGGINAQQQRSIIAALDNILRNSTTSLVVTTTPSR